MSLSKVNVHIHQFNFVKKLDNIVCENKLKLKPEKGNIEGKMATRLDKAISVCLDSVLDQIVLCGRDVCFDM